MGQATTELVCLHCGATVPPHEAADGWCESCGKKLPPGVQSEARRLGQSSAATRESPGDTGVASAALAILGVLTLTAAGVAALLWWR